MEEYLPLGHMYSQKWENATTTMKSIREEMESEVKSTQAAVAMISGMQSEAVPKALEIYRETHDSTRAVTHINQYEKQKAEIMRKEEARRREEEERKRREKRGSGRRNGLQSNGKRRSAGKRRRKPPEKRSWNKPHRFLRIQFRKMKWQKKRCRL